MESNKSLRTELNSEVNINILNEKKIRKYLHELDQCHKTITSQDNIILTHETENQELRSQISNLEKRLRIALEDIKKKDAYISILEPEIGNFQDEIDRLKSRIHEIYSKNIDTNYLLISKEDMARRCPRQADYFDNIQGLLGDIRLYIQNPRISAFNQNQILTKLNIISTDANRLNVLARNNNRAITQLNTHLTNTQATLDLTQRAFLNEQQER